MHTILFKICDTWRRPAFWTFIVGPALMFYGLMTCLSGTMRLEHCLLIGAMLTMNYVPKCRPFFQMTFPFFLGGILYDLLKYVTPTLHAWNPPRVEQPYRLEQFLFGVELADGQLVTLPEWFSQEGHQQLIFDLPCAFAYCFYIYEVFFFALFFFIKDKPLLRRFGWGFIAINILGMLTYYVYPAAPPWYVAEYGFGPAILDTPGNPARLLYVDEYLGIEYFQQFYARASNVFGALPSLHFAYPAVVWLFAKRYFPIGQWFLLAFALLTGFAAVYLGHHYLIDVLLGLAYSMLAYWGVNRLCDQIETRDRREEPQALFAQGS